MLLVFYTVNIMYICLFMTCSVSYCLCDKLFDTWNVCMYVCMYVCMAYTGTTLLSPSQYMNS